jgi:hypothetical protein
MLTVGTVPLLIGIHISNRVTKPSYIWVPVDVADKSKSVWNNVELIPLAFTTNAPPVEVVVGCK